MPKLYLIEFPIKDAKAATLKQYETEAAIAHRLDSAPDGTTRFRIDPRDPKTVQKIPTASLLTVYNILRGTSTKKFVDRATAEAATLRTLLLSESTPATRALPPEETPVDVAPESDTPTSEDEMAKAKAKTKKVAKGERAPRVIEYAPRPMRKIKEVRAGSKLATLIDLLAQSGGATLREIEKALSKSGQPVKARSWLAHSLHTIAGYGVSSVVDGTDIRCKLVYPEGMRKPLAHKVSAAAQE